MASFGHVAVGLLTGRLHGGGGEGKNGGPGGDGGGKIRRPLSWPTLLLFTGLALLPDADLALVALGACDDGACGHRGASHSLLVALAIGLFAGLVARRLRWPVVRTVVAATFAVASHAMLDALGAGGRGLPLLWPFSDARFISPIRIFPDAPRGLALLSIPGAINVAIEFAVFLPMMLYATWPRIMGRRVGGAVVHAIPKLPNLTFLDGAVGPSPAPAAAAAPDERDPPIRSVG
jgi:inner membrane protein